MKLHGLLFFFSSVFAVGVFAACSDSGSGGGAEPDGGAVGNDASASSKPAADGGDNDVGSGNMDAGNKGGTAKDAGSTPTDSGVVVGSCKKINDGMYTVVQTTMRESDVDASAPYQFFCSDNTSTKTYPDSATDLTGCTVTLSGDGCTTTYDCNIDKNGYTEVITGTQTVNADGNGFTSNFSMKWTNDGTGDIALDCAFKQVGTRQ